MDELEKMMEADEQLVASTDRKVYTMDERSRNSSVSWMSGKWFGWE
jgi:hypothetical protein